MRGLILLLLLSGCATKYTKEDVIRINTALIKEQQDRCGDIICESSEDLSRPEVVMRLLSDSLSWGWDDIVDTEYYPIEYEAKEWVE